MSSATASTAPLQPLVQAGLALTSELSLDRVLQKIADVAREVLQARYAALGVIDETGTGLRQFLTAGIDEASRRAIGVPPTGKGVLGLLVGEGRPIRLARLADHPAAAGFPAHHPAMRSFLGVPIIVRGKAYGNLYVTDKQGADEFSAADEDVAMMLAAQAGIAIENAHTVQALRDAQEELLRREKLALLGQLAGSASHELRNPLGVIKNSLYYLRLVLPEEPRARKHLDILEREVATASRIVGDLLDFARIKTPARGPASLDALVGEVLDRTSAPKGVTLVRELAAGLPPVEVDRLHIQQILTNLITNAFQAMPEGGRLTVATHRDPGGAAVSVTDTGTGISPDLLDKIFLPLFTTKVKGIGLGLALARDLASANRAVIEVDSEPGRGSRFTLRFATPGGD